MSQHRNSSYDVEYVAIIKHLVARRKELGMSQGDLAAAYQQNQSFISRIERCRRRIDVLEYIQLCRLLKLDPGETLRTLDF